ncbi:hypothetical protein GCM10022197_23410 [Microlunatus spumicola]|uniref:Uncharacterized protein n=1 Tax=Microlunatus spumicola TaxID=81499 RepID=A0ABP6XI03_9ACTN
MTAPGAAPTADRDADEQANEQADEQAREEARLRLRRGRLVTAVVAGALALVVGVVALLGGFRERTDRLVAVPTGSTIATGPYEVTVARATVQHRTSSAQWEVVASGTVRTTGTTSIDPPVGDAGFLYARGEGGEVQASTRITLGDSTASQTQDTLTPGLPPVPWAVTFRFTADPGNRVFVAVFDQEYTTPYLFSDEKSWRSTSDASTMTVALEPLPDADY